MSRLGLALKSGLELGFVGLWLHILEAKAKVLGEGLAWPGFGLSQGFADFFNRPVMTGKYMFKARAPSPGFGFADLKPKPKPSLSPDFGLAWLCEARALAFGLSGLKPSQAHH
ncbi:hypothetical protein C8R44DRAFT_753861 [Mycena epipterygia]|nr:hypothetical protein C8R44DRAFT_753861 [Mycena epipterygia]